MRLRDIFLNPDERMTVEACERLFEGVCEMEGSVTQVIYAQHPRERGRAWKEIRREVLKYIQLPGAERVRAIRAAMAEAIEHCTTAHFYNHLSDADRDVVARNVFMSTTQVQDQFYYFNHPYNLARAHVLTQMFYLGWSEGDEAKRAVEEVQRAFTDRCKEHCQLVLKIAHAREKGIELGDADKEKGKMVHMMKDLTKRALSGEKLE